MTTNDGMCLYLSLGSCWQLEQMSLLVTRYGWSMRSKGKNKDNRPIEARLCTQKEVREGKESFREDLRSAAAGSS